MRLWREKLRLADGRPFSVLTDIHKATLESVWSAAFGSDLGSTKAQVELLFKKKSIEPSSSSDSLLEFPTVTDLPSFSSILTLTDSMKIPLNSLFLVIHHQFALNFYPSLAPALKHKNNLIKDRLKEAWKTFSCQANNDGNKHSNKVNSALDLIVQREAQVAVKDDRPAEYDTKAIQDEIFGLLVAGHETTATTLYWALKHLTARADVQSKLRSALRSAFAAAVEKCLSPSAEELAKSDIPYLEAFVAENFRCAIPSVINIRVATVDAEVLEHRIPKGTDVFFLNRGPSYLLPSLEVEESLRSKSSQQTSDKYGIWNNSDIGTFNPVRWLRSNENGNVSFEPRAGPSLPFGAGPRGCFGKLKSSGNAIETARQDEGVLKESRRAKVGFAVVEDGHLHNHLEF